MRISYFLVLVLLFACSDDDPASNDTHCRLLKIVADVEPEVVTIYTYNDKDQIVGEDRTRGGVVDFGYIISYTADGMVDKIDVGTSIIEHDYTSDGKILRETFVGKTTPSVIETREYTWDGNSVQTTFTTGGETKPHATLDMTFSNGNVINSIRREYVDFDTKKLSYIIETTSSNFDNGLNPYFVADKYRPGYSIISENNAGKIQTVNTFYVGGVAQPPTSSTTNNVYTYNSSNVAISAVVTNAGTGESYTMAMTYDGCN